MRGRFFARVAIGFGLVFLCAVLACTVGLYLVARTLGQVDLPVGGALAGVLILFGVLGLWAARVVRRAASPVGDMLEASERIAQGDYSVRVREGGPREVRALAGAFNAMAARLQAHDETRRNLLADVTHELRTPLTVVQGNLEGLLDGLYPRDDAHLATILDETRVLSRLIDDLRTLSLADSGALQLRREPTDMAGLAREVVLAFRPPAQAAGIDLAVESEAEVPAVSADPARLREVLSNLVTNALRHTGSGGRVRVALSAPDPAHVQLSVSDTGSGIDAADLPRIFDRFYRAGDSRGSGLGLAIVKNLVEAHGGQVGAESQPGRGTTIRATLPALPAA